jgi:hypothetical protein
MSNDPTLFSIVLQMVRDAKTVVKMLDDAQASKLLPDISGVADRLGLLLAEVVGSELEDITESNAKGYFDGEYDE